MTLSPTHFEFVKKYADAGLELPKRSTVNSAGYDLTIAEDIIVPRYEDYGQTLLTAWAKDNSANDKYINNLFQGMANAPILSLSELAALTKRTKAKPTLVSTGVKCYLQDNQYLELSVRSSTPLKYWLVLVNGVGIIDADYVDNEENEGEIFLQLINLSPFDIQLHKGDKIGQGIIKTYEKTVDDNSTTTIRAGGFGSTSTTMPTDMTGAKTYVDLSSFHPSTEIKVQNDEIQISDTIINSLKERIQQFSLVGYTAEQVGEVLKKMNQAIGKYNG